jgi:hypothetical protein
MMARTRRFQIVFQFGLAAPRGVQIGQSFGLHAHEIEAVAFGARHAPQPCEALFELSMRPAFDRKSLPTSLMIFRHASAFQRNVKVYERIRAKIVKYAIVKRNAPERSSRNDDVNMAALRIGALLRANVKFADEKTGCAEIGGPDRQGSGFIELQPKIDEHKFLTRELLAQQLHVFVAKQNVSEDAGEKKNHRERGRDRRSGIPEREQNQRCSDACGANQNGTFGR